MLRLVVSVFLAAVLAGVAYPALARAGASAQVDAVRPYVREVLHRFDDPVQVQEQLERRTIRLLGHSTLELQHDGGSRLMTVNRKWTPGGEWQVSTGEIGLPAEARMRPIGSRWSRGGLPGFLPTAGRTRDFTLNMWVYEWEASDGTLREQMTVSGYWQRPEWGWMAAPDDVIDVRWIVGDLVYVSAQVFDGVENGEKTQGVASFTVPDRVMAWDLFVTFTPASRQAIGRATNLFANYTHTWLGFKLGVQLSAGPNGSTGTLNVNTDAYRWTRGNGLPVRIGELESGHAAVSHTKSNSGDARTSSRPPIAWQGEQDVRLPEPAGIRLGRTPAPGSGNMNYQWHQ